MQVGPRGGPKLNLLSPIEQARKKNSPTQCFRLNVRNWFWQQIHSPIHLNAYYTLLGSLNLLWPRTVWSCSSLLDKSNCPIDFSPSGNCEFVLPTILSLRNFSFLVCSEAKTSPRASSKNAIIENSPGWDHKLALSGDLFTPQVDGEIRNAQR